VPAILFAGSGNTTLSATGSSAANVLVGGTGDDNLQGGLGADILIADMGHDNLRAGSGGDILIGGYTDYDSNITALADLRKEWSRTDLSYTARINDLTGATSGGYNGTFDLTTSTVHDNQIVDNLDGGSGLDWFFAKLSGSFADVISGRKKDEVVTSL
jgi:Ca2+-binding RTX toxin-like protein